jgi:hypothetical protein
MIIIITKNKIILGYRRCGNKARMILVVLNNQSHYKNQ